MWPHPREPQQNHLLSFPYCASCQFFVQLGSMTVALDEYCQPTLCVTQPGGSLVGLKIRPGQKEAITSLLYASNIQEPDISIEVATELVGGLCMYQGKTMRSITFEVLMPQYKV
jgi:hypothetical protein